ncbi:MAG: tRNA pseudouridine(55) synthase TruB [Cyanobacteria bacterium P01_H01_bin.15]
MLGIVNLDKPSGLTSHDCVAKVRRLAHCRRVGHGGTLDPAATGVLPIALGKATRLLPYLPTVKAYRAIVRFGLRTATDDLEGEILTQQACPELTLAAVKACLPQFIGAIDQIPPAYSALHQDGKRLYELARAGEPIDIEPRPVEVHQLEVVDWRGDPTNPELMLDVTCGPGTYIRAIARDLGEKVETGATLSKLRRTLSCGLSAESAISLEQLAEDGVEGHVRKPLDLLAHLPQVELDAELTTRWFHGQRLSLEPTMTLAPAVSVINNGCFCGVGEIKAGFETPILQPRVVMDEPSSLV